MAVVYASDYLLEKPTCVIVLKLKFTNHLNIFILHHGKTIGTKQNSVDDGSKKMFKADMYDFSSLTALKYRLIRLAHIRKILIFGHACCAVREVNQQMENANFICNDI